MRNFDRDKYGSAVGQIGAAVAMVQDAGKVLSGLRNSGMHLRGGLMNAEMP